MAEVMNQSEVRNRFSHVAESLKRRVVAEVHFGNRGEDELAMLPSADLRELKRLAQKGAMVEGATSKAGGGEAADPWAGLKAALKKDGQLTRPDLPRGRPLPADFAAEPDEAPTWAEMVRRGGAGRDKPEFVRRRG